MEQTSYCPCEFDSICKNEESVSGRQYVMQKDIANAVREQVTRAGAAGI